MMGHVVSSTAAATAIGPTFDVKQVCVGFMDSM